MKQVGVKVIQRSHPKGVTPKMRGRKLRIGVHWQETLKQKGVKEVRCETRDVCNTLSYIS